MKKILIPFVLGLAVWPQLSQAVDTPACPEGTTHVSQVQEFAAQPEVVTVTKYLGAQFQLLLAVMVKDLGQPPVELDTLWAMELQDGRVILGFAKGECFYRPIQRSVDDLNRWVKQAFGQRV